MTVEVKTQEGKVFLCDETTILDAAIQSGLAFEYSCKTGQCGVCKATLLDGEVMELQSQIALSDADKRADRILTCCCKPKTDILIDAQDLSALHGIEIKTLPARINRIKKHTSNHVEITLRLPPSANIKYLEGQYLDVLWNNIRRSYSIASSSSQAEITLLIKRFENGQMSDYWFNQAKENDLIRIEGPKGTFFLRDNSVPLIFLATGTGIAPIIAILNSLDEDESFKQSKQITLYWGNRHSGEFIWLPKFKRLDVNLVKVCSKPDQTWDGEKGYVQDVALERHKDLLECALYACGSNAMIQSSKEQFVKAGLPEKQFYSDAFVQSY